MNRPMLALGLLLIVAVFATATAPPLTGVTTISSGGESAPELLATSLGLKNAVHDLAMTTNSTSQAVTLASNEPDTSYGVSCIPNWNTTVWVTSKQTTQYTLNYATAPTGATMDCVLYRTAP